ncbi:hypothetical protein NPX13_g9036 [Xylaria arbuscula]|uniref:Uncharacterized protein n=1 Tax=Xylaria arbuscula TaxID=114810 RepID=A0A9W8TIW1_9PEZI|nr:hypothetical protein NPX13_g9036 [Xylaria arbuscula]
MQQAQQTKNENMMKGHCLLKLMQFSEHLSNYQVNKGKEDVQYWQQFVDRFFSKRGVFRLSLPVTGSDPLSEEHGPDKQYEIVQGALPRYFYTHFQSGIRQIQLTFEKEFNTTGHEEYVSRKMVINAARPTHLWAKDWKKVNGQDANGSPEMNKKSKKQFKSPPNPPPDFEIPHSAVKGNMGITEPVFQFLEIVEVMGQMSPLFDFYQAHSALSPYQALEQYVNTIHPNAPQQAMMNGHPSGNVPPSQRTPSFSQFPLGASPAASHLQLPPNSPHMGSPAQGHMQAPGMQLQQSQQGTSSSGPSANTSPASNKRRRPSTVKAEEDSGAPTPASLGAPQVNGVGKTKNPPTPRMAHNSKRQKTNAS